MKKIKQIVLLLVLILPVIINADTYDVEVNKANDLLNKKNYINTYQKFIKYGSNLKFEYSNGTNKTNSSFSKGGFISLDEYNLTTIKGVSYLFDGVEYWTLSKNGDNVYAITYDNMNVAKSKSVKYNGRVTEFVNPTVTVHGTGKINNPWTFDALYRLTAVTDSRFATIVSGNDQYVKGGCAENECTARVVIREKTGYRYISNDCNGTYDKPTKTLIVNNLKKDTQCNVTFGRGITSYTNPIIRQVSQTVKSGYTYATSRTIGITYNNTNVENAKYYFKSSVAATVASGVIVESCGTSVNPGTCSASNVTTLSAGTWYRTTNANPNLVYASNGTLYASMGDLIGILGTSSYDITKIDSNTPGTPQIRYNGGSNTCTWKNNYSLTLSSTVFSGIHHYEIDWNGDGNPDNTSIDLSGVYIPTNNFNSHNTRFRAISNSGKASGWTQGQHIHMDTENPAKTQVTYNGGSNTCSWKKDYNLTLSASDNIGIDHYEVDNNADGTPDSQSTSTFIPANEFNYHKVRFRAVDGAGNKGEWSNEHHIHMDTENPGNTQVTYNSGSNTCSWKNNYNITLSANDNISVDHYEVDNNADGTPDSQNNGTFIPANNFHSHKVRFRAVDSAGNAGAWTGEHHIHMDTEKPGKTEVAYNRGANTCTWKKNYNMALSASDNAGIDHYEVDNDADETADSQSASTFIPVNNFDYHKVRFRAVDGAGNIGEWSDEHHIHMDTEDPKFVSWDFGEITASVAKLYINVTDNVGIPSSAIVYDGHAAGLYCKVSTQSGGYTNWHTFNGIWDNTVKSYRCDITPSTFEHYGETYKVQLYVYDYASNGKYYTETTVNIPSLTYAAIPNTETFDATATPSGHCSQPGGLCTDNGSYCVSWGSLCNNGTPPNFNEGYGPGNGFACNCGKWETGPTTYSCPDGATLNGTKCTIITYTCPDGGTLDTSDNMCKF